MRVFFDGQIFIEQVTGGISRYYASLAEGIAQSGAASSLIVAPLHRNLHLKEQRRAPRLGVDFPPQWRLGRVSWAALRTLSPLVSMVGRPDIVHETYFSARPYLVPAKRRITTVFDMIHELYYPGAATSDRKRESISRADHIICISYNTKRDLCEMFGVPEERVSVTHLAYEDFSGADQRGGLPGVDFPYFLFVGNRSGYKNFQTLIAAFAGSNHLRASCGIVAIGGGAFDEEERALIERAGLSQDRVLRLNGGDDILGVAYRNAIALVYPSLYEGFGIPPLEAMSASCPVISSNTSSLPEVVGDAALTFDPTNVESLAELMEQVSGSDAIRAELIVKGHEQRAKFSWGRCVEETLGVYRCIL